MIKYGLLLWGILVCILCSSWGFFAHKLINNTAVFTLPTELSGFFKLHIREITERAIDADKRRYVDSAEAVRHYIDVDRYEELPDSIPIHWSQAKEKYQERLLKARGIVPWQIDLTYRNLVAAFSAKDVSRIIRHAADLGHYVADAHVPLHTTQNYNGQYTDQIGIHAFWETRLPEMFYGDYDLLVGKAEYLSDPLETAWNVVNQSYLLVDSVLSVEKELSQKIPANLQRAYITRNNVLGLHYSDHYASAYHTALNGMVQRRLRSSIHLVGSYWYSAWVDAGQPKLQNLGSSFAATFDRDTTQIFPTKSLGRQEWH
ncbi:zinc dependent phospholipase C family protein [Sphingobacterium sp. lm-10]|uniref:zinc dependent phospholipase C family protein n=1 Tax=Sphingobacterium sp. lm-10 TaxID=2944904 RepID=UPI0020200B13|nr:zinc dependent phospholipase C family protein [Sphingobacterium sp. lm-10]MCL7986468.1 zinc dependent phospholipase C family protein [Sphingobacterium sp. lm-10]